MHKFINSKNNNKIENKLILAWKDFEIFNVLNEVIKQIKRQWTLLSDLIFILKR